MVHVKKCPLGNRGRPTTQFYKDGKPQIYCYGWIDLMYDETLPICKQCADFVGGEQCEKDFQEMLEIERNKSHDNKRKAKSLAKI